MIRVDGKVRARPAGTENHDLPTGLVEIFASTIEVLSEAKELPLPVFGDQEYPEDIRLAYRFLDLRRERIHRNIMKRGAIIDSIRRRMKEQGFLRIPDADPDCVVARRVRAIFWFRRGFIRASSTLCRRPRSSSSSSS